MHFVVEDAWEIKAPILKSLQGQPGSRLFPCVEVGLNQPIWHLDLEFHVCEGPTHWRRFILSAVEQVAATVEEHRGRCRLHLQSSRATEKTTSYEMWAVQEMQTARDQHGRLFHVVQLAHGRLIYPNHNIQDLELVDHNTVYGPDRQCRP